MLNIGKNFLQSKLNDERVNFFERRKIITFHMNIKYHILNGKLFATAADRISIMAFIFQEQNSLGVDKDISGCHGH